MSVISILRASFGLLDTAQRKKFCYYGVLQLSTSILDLLGVFLFSVVVFLGAKSSNFVNDPDEASSYSGVFGYLDGAFGSQEEIIKYLIFFSIMFFICKNFISLFLLKFTIRSAASISAVISTRLASSLFDQQLSFIQKRSKQITAAAVTYSAAYAVVDILISGVILFSEIVLLFVLFAMLFVFDPLVTLLTIMYFASIFYFIQFKFLHKSTFFGEEKNLSDIKSIETVGEIYSLFREIRTRNKMDFFLEYFNDQRVRSSKANSSSVIAHQVPRYLFETSLIFGAAILAFFQFDRNDPQVAVTTFALFLVTGFRFMPSLLRIQSAVTTIRVSGGSAKVTIELSEELNSVAVVNSESDAASLRKISSDFVPSIEVENISFKHPGMSEFAVENVSFTLQPGESLAIVGPSGSGKSTLTDLLLGVNLPESGRISISGVNPSLAMQVWPGSIAYVPQVTSLINGSIKENVALGVPTLEIDEQRIWSVLRICELDKVIRGNDLSLDAPVGENGFRLSGGERQRLGIARALYTSPKLLVMDEATSAMDSQNEALISASMKNITQNVTTIFIAHRLSTVKDADKVLYLSEGRISGIANFQELRQIIPNFDKQAGLLGL
jgi:ABC-type multidrug transport system fused ATPase/permease subunit